MPDHPAVSDADATDPAQDAWEYLEGEGRAPRPDSAPQLSLEGFEGPLDFLLDLARRRRIDLGALSLVALADQFVAALEVAAPLERRGDWLVMAATLLALKAQLLWPATPADAAQADAEARRQVRHLANLAQIRDAANWLAARAQLGIDVFARGRAERGALPQTEVYVAFLEATLVLLEGRAGEDEEEAASDRPARPKLWRVGDAMAHMRRLLADDGAARPLERFLPQLLAKRTEVDLTARAALASTLLAGLELAREGALTIEQETPLGAILLEAKAGDPRPRASVLSVAPGITAAVESNG